MRGTALIYSSHDRSNYLHNDFIVQRALAGNRRILFLPMSAGDEQAQWVSYHSFRWFFDFYAGHGLQYSPFLWGQGLNKYDVDLLWDRLYNDEVVILGGGHSGTGLHRYKELGARFDGEWGKFGRILHERQQRGLLTVGYSAGADQLAQNLFRRTWGSPHDCDGFGLARNVMVTLHHESNRNHELWAAARQFQHCLVFGLPNDAGLNIDQGVLPSGSWWQVIQFVVDTSWQKPEDAWQIHTRSGALIEHVYCDGRHWAFQGGDQLVRVQSPDNGFHQAWVLRGGTMYNYWSQQPDPYHYSVEDVLKRH